MTSGIQIFSSGITVTGNTVRNCNAVYQPPEPTIQDDMAEWLRNGLQIRVPRFDSGQVLHFHQTFHQGRFGALALFMVSIMLIAASRRLSHTSKSAAC